MPVDISNGSSRRVASGHQVLPTKIREEVGFGFGFLTFARFVVVRTFCREFFCKTFFAVPLNSHR
jgi:hypothetical protein